MAKSWRRVYAWEVMLACKTSWIAGLVALAGAGLTSCADRYDHTRFPPEHASCTMEVAVTNMACPERCPEKVWHALKTIRGVGDVEISYQSQRAIVYAAWPACSHDGMEDILVTLESRGYKGAIVRSD